MHLLLLCIMHLFVGSEKSRCCFLLAAAKMDTATAVTNFMKCQEMFSFINVLQLYSHLWPPHACVKDDAVYDFIIVGGGTAGCVIASGLTNYNAKILLVEAGGNPSLESMLPYFFAYTKHSHNDWNFTSTREETLQYHKGSVFDIGQGKMLGGSSGMSYMAYTRGNPADFDHWATLTNDSSWSFDSVLPLFFRSEGIQDPVILNSSRDRILYGHNGTFKLTKYYDEIRKKYFSAFREMGHKIVKDVNVRNPLGFTTVLLSYGDHERSSSAKFLRSVKDNPNLDVLTNALVTKILFDDDKTAIGVKIKTMDGKTITVNSNKEVIITAGVFKTPQLLMVSGIGPKQHLKSKKIKVIKDLPVGRNLQDHTLCPTIFKMGKARCLKATPDPHKFNIPVIDGYIALKKYEKYPDYEIISLILDDHNIFLYLCSISFSFTNEVCDSIIKQAAGRQIYLVFNLLKFPESTGQVLLNTTNIEDQPLINLGYYSNDRDLEMHVKTVLDFNKILNTAYFKSVGADLVHPKLEACAGFNKNTHEYWRCYASGMVSTGHYFVGTCAMGTVVDSKLLVKGVKRLRVADASIMPKIVASPTTAAVLMIAQKTVDMIVKEHSLKKNMKISCN